MDPWKRNQTNMRSKIGLMTKLSYIFLYLPKSNPYKWNTEPGKMKQQTIVLKLHAAWFQILPIDPLTAWTKVAYASTLHSVVTITSWSWSPSVWSLKVTAFNLCLGKASPLQIYMTEPPQKPETIHGKQLQTCTTRLWQDGLKYICTVYAKKCNEI